MPVGARLAEMARLRLRYDDARRQVQEIQQVHTNKQSNIHTYKQTDSKGKNKNKQQHRYIQTNKQQRYIRTNKQTAKAKTNKQTYIQTENTGTYKQTNNKGQKETAFLTKLITSSLLTNNVFYVSKMYHTTPFCVD